MNLVASSSLLAALALAPAYVVQARPDPRMVCPSGSSRVELPGADGARVLRCMDDTTGQPQGPEVWLSAGGFFLQRGRWEDGQRHGLWERWYPSGHSLSRISYDRGQIVSSRCLTEQKRRELPCAAEHHPIDWQPPAASADAAQPADVVEPAADAPATDGGGGAPVPARWR